MAKEDVFNELGYGMKAFIAAEVAFNSNFGEMSIRNGAADTQNITTLADYLKKEKNDKLKNYNPELRDDNRLMTTYVVPLTMPNGERIDIIVNKKGQDIAQIYVNEDDKNRFHLDDSVVEKIRMMTDNAIKDPKYAEEFLPKNIEELAEKISKNELIPKTQEDVKERKEQADSKALEKNEEEIEADEKGEEEKSLEEVASELNVSPSAIEKFCEDQGISPNSIKGSNIIQNTEKLQRQLGTKLQAPDGAEVIALRVDGVNGNQKLAVIGMDGATLDFNESHAGERDEEKLLSEICPTGANGKIGNETDENLKDTLNLEDENGNKEYEANIKHEGNVEYFNERYAKIKAVMEEAKNAIENDSELAPEEKARKIADLEANEYVELEKLQGETGIIIPELSQQELSEAQQAENDATLKEDVAKAKEIMGVVGGTIATGAAIAGVANGVAGINGKKIGNEKNDTEGWSEHDIARFGLGGNSEKQR